MGLDGASLKQKALSDNIANVNTPDYKRKDVDFLKTLKNKVKENKEESLKLEQTSGNHFSRESSFNSLQSGSNDFKISTDNSTSFRNDGNNVDVDVEMTELAKNQIYYNTLTRQINNKFSMIKNVIDKGGR